MRVSTALNSQDGKSKAPYRVLITLYIVLAVAASGRSFYQILRKFDEAPLAYTLSAFAAVIYIVATVALLGKGIKWHKVAWAALIFELTGVLAVGTLSLFAKELFAHPAVWSYFGMGYLFIPLFLPILGMLWLRRNRARVTEHPGA